MKKIDVKTLDPGMIFSEPVYIEGDNFLVPAGMEIRNRDLENLAKMGITVVYTEGELVKKVSSEPVMEQNTKTQDSAAEKDNQDHTDLSDFSGRAKKTTGNGHSTAAVLENKGAYRNYIDLIEWLNTVFSNISTGISVESSTVDNLVGRLLQVIKDEREHVIGFILGGEVSGQMQAKNSINTAILSALISMELKMPHHKVMQVVTGALLHDVGMFWIPKEIIGKSGHLSKSELQQIQTHPLYAYKIITKELLYPEDVGLVALQHHERWDGEGYPRRMAGAEIIIGARIVSVADAFEAMVSEKPYRNSMIGYQAMKNLLSDNSRRFDPDILKAFIKTMGIYPIGSIILLNNGIIARVTEVQGDTPLRPKIRILIDEFGKMYKQDEGGLIDLLAEKSLFIARALDPKEISRKHDKNQ